MAVIRMIIAMLAVVNLEEVVGVHDGRVGRGAGMRGSDWWAGRDKS